jgi:hypothetical protein
MGDGKHCPECGEDIGIWPVFSAGWPDRIWCPHCKARLRYRLGLGLMLGGLALALAAALGSLHAARDLVPDEPLALFSAFSLIFFADWALVELSVVWFLRRHCELELVESKPR